MEQIKVSLEEADLAALEDIARKTGGSISGLIREAVKYWLNGRWGGEKD